ncbi:hypothetical protein BJ165DRAFT_1531318 [Panaeolus papilionaceus]|nr:hypothetical protein BJ165DRAFT_1531318 [Panaeolus papilionaceus]
MAKRMRRPSPELRARPDDHSSPSSDSQDDMADTELEARTPDRADPQPPSTTALPKKKRTRTLTTPHQSAVLHALLAQSRFPTTAMREEVGRSIGLSARKVQIWFQNQRQKARRPRSKSDAPMNRTQYGPFPNTPESSAGIHIFEERSIDHPPYNDSVSADVQPGLNEPPARLLGPGVPGAVGYAPQHSYRQIPPISAPPTEGRFSMGSSFPRASSPVYASPRAHSMSLTRPATSQPAHWRERDPSRTLPPLTMTRPSSAAHGSRRLPSSSGPSHPYMLSRPMFHPPRSTSPEPRFAHLPPDPVNRPPLNLPPPFTLQPPPQWDESSFSTLPRPSSGVWSSHSGARSTRGRSISPVANRREHAGSSTGSEVYYHTERTAGVRSSSPSPRSISSINTPSSRSGRYDPVRSTFIPFSNPVESPAVSPTVTSGHGGRGKENRESPDPDHNRSPLHEDR